MTNTHTPVPEETRAEDERLFSVSILLSASRCLLSYVILPLLTPAIGAVAGSAEPFVGLPIGVLALVFDIRAARRFGRSRYPYRGLVVGLYMVVIALVTTLLVRDLLHLAS
ncbi:MAG: hypothetical protein ACR2HY_10655 [Acidimicrobiales bacterium]